MYVQTWCKYKETKKFNIKYLALEADNRKLTVEIETLKASSKTSLEKLSEVLKKFRRSSRSQQICKALNDKCLKLEAENQNLIIQVKVLKISLNKFDIKVREGKKSLESI